MFLSLFAAISMTMNADSNFHYTIDRETKTAKLTKYSGTDTDVVIPETVDINNVTYSVTSLGAQCFEYCTSVKTVAIPSSVTKLGNGCFGSCSSLMSIYIPSSVTSIGYNCFRECEALEAMTVDDGNTVYDSRENCNAIIETESNTMIAGCMNTVIPSSVTSLGKACFYGHSSLKSITIPSSVTKVEDWSFGYCSSLESVSIPSSVTSLGNYCFYVCPALKSIDIPSSVTEMGNECFGWCSSLESVTLSASVTNIKQQCFFNCSSLKSIDIPSSVTELGAYCFGNCTSLTSVNIPSSVTSIFGSFYGCSAIEAIVVDKDNTMYDSRNNCNAVIETATNTLILGCMNTVIPSSVTNLYDGSFNSCSSLASISIPSSVTSIGSSCFSGCSSLTAISIPSSVTSIGSSCFSGCSSLASMTVDVENSVYDSRENCNAIIETATNTMINGCMNTVIPSSVTSLGDYCFDGCSSLIAIAIPNSVTNIGAYCFSGCSFTKFTIPSTVTSLGNWCFASCELLESMTCEIPTAIKGGFFDNDTPVKEATLYVPEASLDSYKTTVPWKNFGAILPISTDGINNCGADQSADIVAVYNREGKKTNGLNRGINIVRMSDGTTKKVFR